MRKILTLSAKIIGMIFIPVVLFMAIHLLVCLTNGFFYFIAGKGFTINFISFYLSHDAVGISLALCIIACLALLAKLHILEDE